MKNSKHIWLAIAWALVVSLTVAHVTWLFSTKRFAPETDILAMLPTEERDPVLQQAIVHMADSAQQRFIVLIGAEDWRRAQSAADAYRGVLASRDDQFRLDQQSAARAEQGWIDQFWPYRGVLLNSEQRDALKNQPTSYWVDAAQRQLYSPFGAIKVGTWQDDPFGLFAGWAQTRAQQTSVRPSDGRLRVDAGNKAYVVMPIELRGQAFSLATQQAVMPVLQQAREAALRAAPDAEVISAGIILHAAAAGQQASQEMSTIGLGSLAGILLLMWLTFRSVKPIGMVVLSVGVGCLGALSVCWLLFDRLHLLTLVFGASLIGVAHDYGIHYLCSRLGDEQRRSPSQLLQEILPGMILAILTTVVAYLTLALTPFPGLRQVAVFSAVGLLFAWLTVIFWFPVLDRTPMKKSPVMDWYGRSRQVWPRLGRNFRSYCVAAAVLIFAVAGISRLKSNDDIRQLQNSPQSLLDAQIEVSRLLAAPTLAQFYLVRGETQEMVLQHEEALKNRLENLVASNVLTGYQALSDWVPSQRTQRANHELTAHSLMAPGAALPQLATLLGEGDAWTKQIQTRHAAPVAALTPELFLQNPAGEAWRHLWLGKVDGGYASIVALRGVEYGDLPALQATAQTLPGVQWVDKVGETSTLLGRYRHHMGWVVLISYATVYLLLLMRYRGAAWRVMAPTVVASALALAVFGFIGHPLNLFHVLALLLILGMGIDYGIFLQEHPSRKHKAAWLAVGLSAMSTLLAFGLLGLSTTPALQAFGLTMLIGVGAVWLIAPCFGKDE
ncbi:MAG: transporter [Burkholderiales bacterium RIFCSPLOWO2_02_FULL_57_36]|nr:MAG: transporter [Burkholderiales bacterium RIFCSPLOWO2_02_FULL_57_36]